MTRARSPTRVRAFELERAAYKVLGTDGFGRCGLPRQPARILRSDPPLCDRRRAEVLADDGEMLASMVGEAIKKYGIDPNEPNPVTLWSTVKGTPA